MGFGLEDRSTEGFVCGKLTVLSRPTLNSCTT
jgi:hypothetical protein